MKLLYDGEPVYAESSATITKGPAKTVIITDGIKTFSVGPISEIRPVQDELAAPSLSAWKYISGRTSVVLTHNSDSITQELSTTVYGGSFNWLTGVLTITQKIFELPVTSMVTVSGEDAGWMDVEGLGECFGTDIDKTLQNQTTNFGSVVHVNGSTKSISLEKSVYNLDLNGWKDQHSRETCQFVFPLLVPQIIQLDKHFLSIELDTDVFTSSSGDTTVVYSTPIKSYVDKRIEDVNIANTIGPENTVTVTNAMIGSRMYPVSDIVPVQEANPTLDDPKPISPVTNIRLTYNGDTLDRELGDNVYGGTYDWSSGILTITHKLMEFKVSEMNNTAENTPGWQAYNTGLRECFLPGTVVSFSDVRTNFAKIGTPIGINLKGAIDVLFIDKNALGGAMTYTKWQSDYYNMTCQFVFKLLSPKIVQLTPKEFIAVANPNVFTSSSGNTTVSYEISIKDYIDSKIR